MDPTREVLRFHERHGGSADVADVALAAVALLASLGHEAALVVDGVTYGSVEGEGERTGDAEVELRLATIPDEDTRALILSVSGVVRRAAARSRAHPEKRRVIHDMRGALAVISGQCEMLEIGIWGELTPAQARSVQTLLRQVDKLQTLVERTRALVSS